MFAADKATAEITIFFIICTLATFASCSLAARHLAKPDNARAARACGTILEACLAGGAVQGFASSAEHEVAILTVMVQAAFAELNATVVADKAAILI